MAHDPELKDAGNTLVLLLKQSGQIEASRFIVRAVRESGVAALQLNALQKLQYFPDRPGEKTFQLPKNTLDALAYLKEVATRLIHDLKDQENNNDAPAPFDFSNESGSNLETWKDENTLGATPAPLGFLAPTPEDEEKILPEAEVAPPQPEADNVETNPQVTVTPDAQESSDDNDAEDDIFTELEKNELPYETPFFDGVDRLFFAGHQALAYFIQSLYHHNAMPIACTKELSLNQEFAVTLINHNKTSSLLDAKLHISKSGAKYFIFERLQEVETEARTICEEIAWMRIRSEVAQKPRPPKEAELRGNDTVLFHEPQDFNAVLDDIRTMSAVMVTTTSAIVSPFQEDIIIQVAGSKFLAISAQIQPMGAGRLVVSFLNQSQLQETLNEIETAIQENKILEDQKTAGLSLTGPLKTPHNATDLLEQSFENQPTTMDLNQPSPIILLRILTGATGICEIIIKQKDGTSCSFFLQDGLQVYARLDEVQIANQLSKPGAFYAILERPKVPIGLKKLHLVKILANTTRLLFEQCEEEGLFNSLATKLDLAPKLTSLGEKRVHILNLPKLVQRHVSFKYNGQETGKNLLLVEGNRKLGLEAMAVLEMHNFLEWTTPTLSLRDRVETLFEHHERIKDADPFESLALHWFCAPIEIIESYHEHRQLYGPQGSKRKNDAEWAEKIWSKVESAFRYIDDKKSRDLFRKEHHNKKKRKDMATHLIKQARMDIFRHEDFVAQRKLEAAMDIYPNSAAQNLLDELSGKKS